MTFECLLTTSTILCMNPSCRRLRLDLRIDDNHGLREHMQNPRAQQTMHRRERAAESLAREESRGAVAAGLDVLLHVEHRRGVPTAREVSEARGAREHAVRCGVGRVPQQQPPVVLDREEQGEALGERHVPDAAVDNVHAGVRGVEVRGVKAGRGGAVQVVVAELAKEQPRDVHAVQGVADARAVFAAGKEPEKGVGDVRAVGEG